MIALSNGIPGMLIDLDCTLRTMDLALIIKMGKGKNVQRSRLLFLCLFAMQRTDRGLLAVITKVLLKNDKERTTRKTIGTWTRNVKSPSTEK